MSMIGLAYSFLDRYDPGFISNGSDDGGRYAYKEQPEICKWNVMKLGEAIQLALPLTRSKPKLTIFDDEYRVTQSHHHRQLSPLPPLANSK